MSGFRVLNEKNPPLPKDACGRFPCIRNLFAISSLICFPIGTHLTQQNYISRPLDFSQSCSIARSTSSRVGMDCTAPLRVTAIAEAFALIFRISGMDIPR